MQRASQIMKMNTELNKSRTTLTCMGGDDFFKTEQGCPLLEMNMQKMNLITRTNPQYYCCKPWY